ncbi:MAG: methyltransferase, partial [Proteobacteria bacterium]|nr:methyltransferase [Pseudomonadota bacterium]
MKDSTDSLKQVVHVPHRLLTDYYADEQERRGFVRTIFDRTASDYDRVERLLALGSGPWYRGQALQRAGLRAAMRVVDVGVGTGLMAREAAKLVGDPALVTGIDPSVGMMANARLPAGV